MRKQNDEHLLQEQIIWAVVDEKELSEGDQLHLMGCQLCQGRASQLMAELQVFGERAKFSVPLLTKVPQMPAPERSTAKYRLSWFPFAGAAAMAGLVLFFYFMGINDMSPELTTVQGPDGLLEDEYLMQEISEMVEHPLPEELYEITGDPADFDDDFLQFVVPDFQENSQS
jgi:hypothetical protein